MPRFEQSDVANRGAVAHLARLPVVAAIAALAGYGASLLGIPLGWLLGALIATATIGIAVRPVSVPPPLYKLGQVIVGVAVGLTVSADIVSELGPHALLAPVAAVLSIAVGRALCPVLWRFAAVDRATAYFSLVPAGIAEMAEQAGQRGADVGAVATFHAFRVGLMVLVLPLLVFVVVGPGAGVASPEPQTWRAAGWTPSFGVALVIGGLAALGARRIGVPSAYVLGPMAVLAVLSGAGLIDAREPDSVLAVAQVMLGLGIGARFTRATMGRLPRALAVGLPLMIGHAGILVGLGVVVALGFGLDPVVLALGASTGGIAEMVLTAKAVGADAALVTFYQVVRGLAGNLTAGLIFERTVAQAVASGEGGRDD
ncbi:MAG: AbrB family transcriptional regulator [Paracoccaceae bacterium]|jgi:membrane AbrB-like protein|nr:AbrB family transcriptional regulator [Paracoccaceae bacterium]